MGPASSLPCPTLITLETADAPACTVASCTARSSGQIWSGVPWMVVPMAPTSYTRPDCWMTAMAAST